MIFVEYDFEHSVISSPNFLYLDICHPQLIKWAYFASFCFFKQYLLLLEGGP